MRTAGSVALVAAIFGFAVPHFASYRSVWASIHAMTWAQALLVVAAAAATWRHAPALVHAKPAAAGEPADVSPSGPDLALRQHLPAQATEEQTAILS